MARKRARISGEDVFAQTDLPERQYTGKSVNQQDIKYPKTKVTYYVPEDLADRIDAAHLGLRRIVRGRKRKLSKSDLATAALELALRDFTEHGEESQLVDLLSNR
jgi:hypothetical protein